MLCTESEKNFWKAHSMSCGYSGEFKKETGYPEDPINYAYPVCGSAYRPEQELNGGSYPLQGRAWICSQERQM
jgi:hypothetical protein